MIWRKVVKNSDVEPIRNLVASTTMFTKEEINIAAELVSERIERGRSSGYEFLLALKYHELAGFTCYGIIPGTESSFDLYWIAVDPGRQGRGYGRQLLDRTEDAVREVGGKRLYAETSSTDRYVNTRRFYDNSGFKKVAELPDFYHPGDGKVIYEKPV